MFALRFYVYSEAISDSNVGRWTKVVLLEAVLYIRGTHI
jgi:hypothetical protein